jgi:drug/metabolite transporter (DMT)-like permease
MAKIILILVIAAMVESVGVAFLSGGLKEVQGVKEITVSEILRVAKSGMTNGKILLGVALEAAFFGALLYLLSKRSVSFVWPMTSLGFIFTTLAAAIFLHEKVSPARWAGVVLIALGASFVSYSEAANKAASAMPAPTAASASASPSGSATLHPD